MSKDSQVKPEWEDLESKGKESRFDLGVLASDLLAIYKMIARYFKACLHEICTDHARRNIAKTTKNLPAETNGDKSFRRYDKRQIRYPIWARGHG